MKSRNTLRRNTHFLGTKIRNLRKRNNLTLEDLSVLADPGTRLRAIMKDGVFFKNAL